MRHDTSDDPFERAVAAEQRLRSWAADTETPAAVMRMAFRWVAIVAGGWAVLLALHWLLLPDPRWLAELHAVVFAGTLGYWLISSLFVKRMLKRMPMFQR